MIELLTALAVARVSVFIVRERAPFAIMARIRELFGTPNGETVVSIPRNEIAHLINCVWCISIWIGLIACLLLNFPLWYALPFSAVAIIYDEKIS